MWESTQGGTPSCKGGGVSEAVLLAQHEGLVHWVVRRQWLGPLSFGDALHEGRIGLWQALRRYDPARGTTFSTYAVPAIARAVWAAVAREQATGRGIPQHLEVGGDDGDPGELLHAAAVVAAVRLAVRALPAPLAEVVIAHVGLEGMQPEPFAAIGARLGRTKQRAHQLYGAALERLAHPSHSLPLRQLTGRLTRREYQATLGRQQRRARARRQR